MTRTEAFVPTLRAAPTGPCGKTLSADEALQPAGVEEQQGLSSAETAVRADRFGPDKAAESAAEFHRHAFNRQYTDSLQIVLLAAGVSWLYPLKRFGTGRLLANLAVALSIIVVPEIRKALLRRPIGTVAEADVRAPLVAAPACAAFP